MIISTVVTPFIVEYDHFQNVLHFSVSRTPSISTLVSEDDYFQWRFAKNDELVGVTLMDFMEHWTNEKDRKHMIVTLAYIFRQEEEIVENQISVTVLKDVLR